MLRCQTCKQHNNISDSSRHTFILFSVFHSMNYGVQLITRWEISLHKHQTFCDGVLAFSFLISQRALSHMDIEAILEAEDHAECARNEITSMYLFFRSSCNYQLPITIFDDLNNGNGTHMSLKDDSYSVATLQHYYNCENI